ncbi:UbiA family prenyltransferase [Maritimibacter sp. UBA3975]|uniref:UbiA family prenyltransferase n=1 Tax=Maritimibacter sp. UBA3975 TaxID=1946833 RepID=UPI0025BC63B8|nr:UbiA family prenyltransferase [Maritimibacter sp. UBA3975]|tara:strand:- start:53 stop:1495 length:1443 start_codon:yes stop_codon:yes gene_type:complete
MTDTKPLVLDVDGTFLRTDLLYETFWAGLGQAPLATIRACFAHLTDPARLKAELVALTEVRTDLMPVNPAVMAEVERAKGAGREVVLASASNHALVERLAADHDLSPRVFASTATENLKGKRKAAALVEAFGEGGFDYAGNDTVDREVWAHADGALVVGEAASARAMEAAGKPVTRLAGGWSPRGVLKALRPHQWVKNVLLFVPVLAAHDFRLETLALVLLGMLAFSFGASAIYVVNDLLDLEADRLHVKKKHRPFASGAVPISVGMATGAGVGLAALLIAALLSPGFLAVIVCYMCLSLAYSLKLKRLRWIDIGVLAGLYTLRVVAGAYASGVDVSGYLLAFIFPAFLTLGCVKRLTEVTLAEGDERLPGRGYGKPDRPDLLNVAVLGVAGALISFFLYSFTDQAIALYPTQWLVWATLVPITWWLVRMLRLGYYGKQDHDPIVFAMKDKRGLGILMIAIAMLFQAAGLWEQWVTAAVG